MGDLVVTEKKKSENYREGQESIFIKASRIGFSILEENFRDNNEVLIQEMLHH